MKWDTEGMARYIVEWMKYDDTDLDVLDLYIHHDIYLAIKDKDKNAEQVCKEVKSKVIEIWNEES